MSELSSPPLSIGSQGLVFHSRLDMTSVRTIVLITGKLEN
jgi:hypothetical protein